MEVTKIEIPEEWMRNLLKNFINIIFILIAIGSEMSANVISTQQTIEELEERILLLRTKALKLSLYHNPFCNESDKSMEDLLKEIKSCNFEQIPENFLNEYTTIKSVALKSPYQVDIPSLSTIVSDWNGEIDLSNLNFGWLEDHKHTLRIDVLANIETLEKMLCDHIFNGNSNTFDYFVSIEIHNLKAIRTLIYNKYMDDSTEMHEVSYVQPLFTLMEADFIERIQKHEDCTIKTIKIRAAQRDPLNAQVSVFTSETKTKKVNLSGCSDILIYEESGADETIVRLQELKASLKDSSSFIAQQWKSQLCGQIYCLGDMNKSLDFTFGGLLDLFSICIVIRDSNKRYLISDRITDPRSFIVVLMLNLFGLPKDQIEKLYSTSNLNFKPYFPKAEYLETTSKLPLMRRGVIRLRNLRT